MNSKILAIVSYATLLGWFISFVKKSKSDDFLNYHLKQSLGLIILSVTTTIILQLLASGYLFIAVAQFIFFIFMVLGMINAANLVKRPIPFIGLLFEHRFPFLS